MNNTQSEPPPIPVPWTARDVWSGMGCMGLWMLILVILQFALSRLNVKVEMGVFLIFSEVVLILPVWLLGIRKYGVRWERIGLRRFAPRFIGLGMALLGASYLFNIVYSLLVLTPLHQTMQGDLMNTLGKSTWSIWLWVGGVAVAPFVEEVFFRGFIFGGLRNRYTWQTAAVMSAALFSLVHLQWTSILPIFVIGFFLAYLYERSHSIWPGIMVHMLINGLGFIAAYFLY